MPFFTVDDEEGEAYFHRRGTWYEPATVFFDFDSAGCFMLSVRRELLDKAIIILDCTYDEGFASAMRACTAEGSYNVNELVEMFRTSSLPRLAIEAYSGQGMPSGEWEPSMRQTAEAWPLHEQVQFALDWFAQGLAGKLLGDGFGTGNYSIRGQFQVDLKTGELKDLLLELE